MFSRISFEICTMEYVMRIHGNINSTMTAYKYGLILFKRISSTNTGYSTQKNGKIELLWLSFIPLKLERRLKWYCKKNGIQRSCFCQWNSPFVKSFLHNLDGFDLVYDCIDYIEVFNSWSSKIDALNYLKYPFFIWIACKNEEEHENIPHVEMKYNFGKVKLPLTKFQVLRKKKNWLRC